MNFTLLTFIFFACQVALHTQNRDRKIDSLTTVLKEARGMQRVGILCQLSAASMDASYDSSLIFSNEAFNLSLGTKDYRGLVRSGRLMAKAHRERGRIDSAINVYQFILRVAEENVLEKETIQILNGYALALTYNAQYDQALKMHFAALNHPTIGEDSLSIAVTYHNIGFVYYKLKEYDKALSFFLDCYALKKRINDGFDQDLLLINIGLCYAYLGDFVKPKTFIDDALALCNNECHPQRIIEADFAYGVIFYGRKDLLKSAFLFDRSLSGSRNLKDVRFQLDNLYYLSQISIELGNWPDARLQLAKAKRLISQYPGYRLEKVKLYSRLAEFYRTIRDHKIASANYFKYASLEDSIYSKQLTRNLMRVEGEYLEKENLAKIASQNEIISLNQDIIRRQDTINALSVFLIAISAGFLVIFYRNIQNKKRLNTLLDEKIDERTRELNTSHADFMKTFRERELMLARNEKNYTELTLRLDALCRMGLKDVIDPAGRDYITKMGALAQQVEQRVNIK